MPGAKPLPGSAVYGDNRPEEDLPDVLRKVSVAETSDVPVLNLFPNFQPKVDLQPLRKTDTEAADSVDSPVAVKTLYFVLPCRLDPSGRR